MPVIFVAAVCIIALIFIWFMPKRLSRKEIYITWWIPSAIAYFLDLTFGVAPWDLFDFLKDPKPEMQSIIVEMIMPACFAIIFLNYMPKKRLPFLFYLAGYVLLSVIMEWLTTLSGYLIYKGWKLWYSGLVYAAGCLFLRWHLYFIRRPDDRLIRPREIK